MIIVIPPALCLLFSISKSHIILTTYYLLISVLVQDQRLAIKDVKLKLEFPPHTLWPV